MAVPPSYSDLGKSAKDIFSKGYGFGVVKLDLKTKSQSGVEFNTSGSSNTDTGKAAGSLETKYKMKELGLSFNQKWNTDNTLATEVTVEDQLTQGLKVALETSFVPNTGKKSGKLKTAYKRDFVNLGCDVDFEGPIIHAAAVLGYEGWIAGYQMAFDTAKSKLAQNNFALGYKAGDFQLHTNVNDGTEFGGSIYQKVNEELETAVTLAWTAGSNNTRFGIAAKYKLDKDASLSAKVNNASLIGVGYTQSLRPGRREGYSLSSDRREELQRRRSQGGDGLRAGGVTRRTKKRKKKRDPRTTSPPPTHTHTHTSSPIVHTFHEHLLTVMAEPRRRA
ncbi:non-selective voltage-gated ion channel VDAC2 isoform X2 [Anarhichas minor]|uniref:non-selective voltage-gated ion channel VDAC2 isoform X2 n=1 Tax=Anarhichas minor TaxID=65739 RepID=UPI003F740F5E